MEYSDRRQCIFSFVPYSKYAFELSARTCICEVIAAIATNQQVYFINLTFKDVVYLLSILQGQIVLNSDKFIFFRPGVL